MNCIIALVPVKPLDTSKSRLAPALSDDERKTLSIQLLKRVLTALQEAGPVDDCWVIGGDDVIQRLAEGYDACWLPELGSGLNDTLARALEQLPEDVTHALILPMDLPFLTGRAVSDLTRQATEGQADVVIAPDRWAQGSNALLLSRSPGLAQGAPFGLRPAFGEGSLHRHRQMAESQGLRVVTYQAHELSFDIDTPTDLSESGFLMTVQEQPR